jgi:hypothetical protein
MNKKSARIYYLEQLNHVVYLGQFNSFEEATKHIEWLSKVNFKLTSIPAKAISNDKS